MMQSIARNSTLDNMRRMLGELRRDVLTAEERIARLNAEGANSGDIIAWLSSIEVRLVPLIGHSHQWGDITSKPATFPPDIHDNVKHDPDYLSAAVAWNDITGKPTAFPPDTHAHTHTHAYSDISGTHSNEAHNPNYLSGVTWDEVMSKPSEFPSTPHTHDYAATGHNHSGTYSATGHTHDYAPNPHSSFYHSEGYAPPGHAHSYASSTHAHVEHDSFSTGGPVG